MCSTLLIGFSATVKAETITGFEIRQDVYLIDKDGDIAWEFFEEFTPNNKTQEKYEHECDYYEVRDIRTMELKHRTVWNIFSPASGYPFVLNKVNRISLENFYYRYLLDDINLHYVRQYDDIYLVVTYADNTTERFDVDVYADTDSGIDINFDITPTKNISRVDLYVDSNIAQHMPTGYDYQPVTITSYFGEMIGDNQYNFNIEIQSEEASLLGGIIEWLKGIFNKMGDIVDAIIELPVTIWNKIESGLKALFVPSDQATEVFFDRMNALLEDRLGSVYEVIDMIHSSWVDIETADTTNTITIPEVTIDLPEGETFTFGGYEVKVVPDGFEFLATALKTIIALVLTPMFVNALGRRYDDVVEG